MRILSNNCALQKKNILIHFVRCIVKKQHHPNYYYVVTSQRSDIYTFAVYYIVIVPIILNQIF